MLGEPSAQVKPMISHLAKRVGNYACTTAYRRVGNPVPFRGFSRCPRGGIGRRA